MTEMHYNSEISTCGPLVPYLFYQHAKPIRMKMVNDYFLGLISGPPVIIETDLLIRSMGQISESGMVNKYCWRAFLFDTIGGVIEIAKI